MKHILLSGMLLCTTMFAPAFTNEAMANDISASIVKTRPIVQNRRSAAILHLKHKKNNIPVMAEELELVDNRRMQLFLLDPSFNDFHHTHVNPLNRPGEYIFTVTPNTACGYKLWAEIDTKSKDRHFVRADVPGAQNCKKKADFEESLEFENMNFNFKIESEAPVVKAGETATLKLTVRETEGRYVRELQPVMGSFGHVVLFYDDFKTIQHVHADDDTSSNYYDEAGPVLKFSFTPEREGMVRVFAEVKINDIVNTIPFVIRVGEEEKDNSGNLFLPSSSGVSIDDILGGSETKPRREDPVKQTGQGVTQDAGDNAAKDFNALFGKPREPQPEAQDDSPESTINLIEGMGRLGGG